MLVATAPYQCQQPVSAGVAVAQRIEVATKHVKNIDHTTALVLLVVRAVARQHPLPLTSLAGLDRLEGHGLGSGRRGFLLSLGGLE